MVMASTEEQFDRAVEYIQNLPKEGPYKLSSAKKLRFHALHKQSTTGPCKIPRPSWWNFRAKAKWNEWTNLGDMSKGAAMTTYVDELEEFKMAASERARAAQH